MQGGAYAFLLSAHSWDALLQVSNSKSLATLPNGLTTPVNLLDWDRDGAKSAMSWDASGRSLVDMDGNLASDANAVPAMPSLRLGSRTYLDFVMDGWIKSLVYFPTRKPDTELQAFV